MQAASVAAHLSRAAATQATGAAARSSADAVVQAPNAARAAEVQAALQGLDIGEAEAGLRKARASALLRPQPAVAFQVSGRLRSLMPKSPQWCKVQCGAWRVPRALLAGPCSLPGTPLVSASPLDCTRTTLLSDTSQQLL